MHTSAHTAGHGRDAPESQAGNHQDGSTALGRSKDELVQEFRNLVNEGEALLKATTSLSGDALAQARDQFRERLAEAKTRIETLSAAAQEGGRRAVVAADEYVRQNPWPSVGMAAGLGFVVGALTLRRWSR